MTTPWIETRVFGIDDPTLVAAVEAALADSLPRTSRPGVWRMTVAPSSVAGRWDVTICWRGLRHVMAITVPRESLPVLIPLRVRASLERAAAHLVDRMSTRRRSAYLTPAASINSSLNFTVRESSAA